MKKQEEEKGLVTTGFAKPPAFIKGEAGLKNIKPSDVTLSFVKIAQNEKQPEVKNKLIELGHMFDSLTVQDFGTELVFIPLFDQKQAIKWIPRESGGGIECISPDGKSGSKYGNCETCQYYYRKWNNEGKTSKEKQPACSEYFSFPSLISGNGSPIVVSFAKSTLKAGKKLIKLYMTVASQHKVPLYSCKFKLFLFEDVGPTGDSFYNVDIAGAGFVNEEEFQVVEKMNKLYSKVDIKVDLNNEE